MIKNTVQILAVVAATMVVMTRAVPAATEKYTTKYDNVNVDEIMSNDRLLNRYFKCLMSTDKCTADGAELKRKL